MKYLEGKLKLVNERLAKKWSSSKLKIKPQVDWNIPDPVDQDICYDLTAPTCRSDTLGVSGCVLGFDVDDLCL